VILLRADYTRLIWTQHVNALLPHCSMLEEDNRLLLVWLLMIVRTLICILDNYIFHYGWYLICVMACICINDKAIPIKYMFSTLQGISDNSCVHSQTASKLTKQWNSEKQLLLHSSFPCTAAFPAQPASHSPNKQALNLLSLLLLEPPRGTAGNIPRHDSAPMGVVTYTTLSPAHRFCACTSQTDPDLCVQSPNSQRSTVYVTN
jgi:hypothetical protein